VSLTCAPGRLLDLDRLIARRYDRFERFPLELHRTLDRVDQVRNQVMPSLQLHVDLLPRIRDLILQTDQLVVGADEPEDQHR
jgi:hypothetical protein